MAGLVSLICQPQYSHKPYGAVDIMIRVHCWLLTSRLLLCWTSLKKYVSFRFRLFSILVIQRVCECYQVELSGARLLAILKGYGEYPAKYRLLIFASLTLEDCG